MRAWIQCGVCGTDALVEMNGVFHRYQLCAKCYASTTHPDPVDTTASLDTGVSEVIASMGKGEE